MDGQAIAGLAIGLVEKLIPIALEAFKNSGANTEEIKAKLLAAIADAHAAITSLPAQLAADDAEALAAAKLKP